MELSRKRRRELKRLKGTASELWDEQREVLDRATQVLGEARRQLANVGREEIAPRVRDVFDNRVVPGVASGIATTRSVARGARDRVTDTVLPAITSALGSALTMAELAKDPRVREAIIRVREGGSKLGGSALDRAGFTGSKPVVAPAPKSSGPVRIILMGIGLAAVIGVAYTAWQTLRADDESWVGDESEELDEL